MARFFFSLFLCIVPFGVSAQHVSLPALFEEICIAPFDMFFGETEGVLRRYGFDLYPNDDFMEFEDMRTGVTGAYSSYTEDLFCMIHDPRGNPESASSAARVLLGHYFDETPKLVPVGTGLVAWGVPYGTCCYLTVRVDDTSPLDVRQGASLSLFLLER